MLLGPNSPYQEIVDCFVALQAVKEAIFSLTCDADYAQELQVLLDCWRTLGLSFTPKAHILFKHVPEFLESFSGNHGLGYFSEQTFEAIHRNFWDFWTSGYQRNIGHRQYKEKLRECVRTYVARRI